MKTSAFIMGKMRRNMPPGLFASKRGTLCTKKLCQHVNCNYVSVSLVIVGKMPLCRFCLLGSHACSTELNWIYHIQFSPFIKIPHEWLFIQVKKSFGKCTRWQATGLSRPAIPRDAQSTIQALSRSCDVIFSKTRESLGTHKVRNKHCLALVTSHSGL